MIQEWVNHEHISLEYIKKTISWLREFYVEESHLFRVAYSTGDLISSVETPNAASSIINIVLRNLDAQYVHLSDIPGWDDLYRDADQVPSIIASAKLEDALPLKSFGILPLFSTCYLAESLASIDKALSIPTYAITIRRILYELYLRQRQQAPQFTRIDPLHPFLLFRCAKALLSFRAVAEKASTGEKEEFSKNLLNIELLKDAVRHRINDELNDKALEAEIDEVFGTGEDAEAFKNILLTVFNTDSSEPSAVDNGLQVLERKSLNTALAELAKLQSTKRGTIDPSSLVFSLNVLAELNYARHTPVIIQGLNIVLVRSEQGLFRSTLPFHIDNKGRATFVPSIEVINVALAVFLRLIDKSSPDEISSVIAITKLIQDDYIESFNLVEVQDTSGTLGEIKGWCSDTAPSVARVDSWVTVHVLAFFARQLSILRYAKRHHILQRYSWMPQNKISPSWENIVDPDMGVGDRSAKNVIEAITRQPLGDRKKAPVFILYGPPGTSKTTLVNGVAKRMGWDLITLSPSDFIAESLDLIEQQSRKIFLDLMNMDECVILLDEMDSLLRDRELLAEKSQGSLIEFVVPAFLPKLQQLRDHAFKNRIAVFFVTNYYETIDRAILRAGRIDAHVLVLPYNKNAQVNLLTGIVAKASSHNSDLKNRSLEFIKNYIESNEEISKLITFREAEQLVELVMRNDATPSERDLVEWSAGLSITPDIYAKREISAFREVCAVIGRVINDNSPSSKYTSMTMENAKVYLKSNQHRLGDSPWSDLSERWIRAIETELSKR